MLNSSGAASSELDQAQDHPSRNPARSLAAPSPCTGCGIVGHSRVRSSPRCRLPDTGPHLKYPGAQARLPSTILPCSAIQH